MSMNVFFLFISASKLSFSKRLQKYNFFLIPQAFLKKNFLKILTDKINPSLAMNPNSSRFGRAKIISFSFTKQAFLKLFFIRYETP